MYLDSLLGMYNAPQLESNHRYKKLKAIWDILFSNRFFLATIKKTEQATDYDIISKRTSSDDLTIIANHLLNTTYAEEQEYTLLDIYRILHQDL